MIWYDILRIYAICCLCLTSCKSTKTTTKDLQRTITSNAEVNRTFTYDIESCETIYVPKLVIDCFAGIAGGARTQPAPPHPLGLPPFIVDSSRLGIVPIVIKKKASASASESQHKQMESQLSESQQATTKKENTRWRHFMFYNIFLAITLLIVWISRKK